MTILNVKEQDVMFSAMILLITYTVNVRPDESSFIKNVTGTVRHKVLK